MKRERRDKGYYPIGMLSVGKEIASRLDNQNTLRTQSAIMEICRAALRKELNRLELLDKRRES
jgi:hypothetical protein